MSDGQRGDSPAMPDAQPPWGPQTQPTPPRAPRPLPQQPGFAAADLQSALTRSRDQSRFVAPEPATERTSRPFPVRALLWVSVAMVVIGVIGGVVYVTYFRGRQIDPDVIVKATGTPSNQVRAQTPQEIVTDYFKALSDGDIDRALAMGPRGGNGSERLLSPQAFTRTRELSALNSVQVLTTDPEATKVQVSYRLGDSPVTTEIALDRLDTGEYQLKRSTVPIQIDVPGGEGLPLLINGQGVDQGQVYEAVPGIYQLDTGLPFISYPDTSRLSVITLDDVGIQKSSPVPQLTQAGLDAFLSAASKSLDSCLAERRKAPAGCPVGMDPSLPIVESSITRSLANDPWASARPSLKSSRQSQVEVTVTIGYRLGYTWNSGGTQNPTLEQKVATVTADMLASRADQVRVVWE